MDYVVGSIAALITGNVTPNRPKRLKKAETPIKHQPSPNVTPKCELAEDRSIFMSPTMQKKKAVIKKSPKRIFQNTDLDTNPENDEMNNKSPKADKVKKHLKEKLDTHDDNVPTLLSVKSPENLKSTKQKNKKTSENIESSVRNTSLKKKKKKSVTETKELGPENIDSSLEDIGKENMCHLVSKDNFHNNKIESQKFHNTSNNDLLDVAESLSKPLKKKKNKESKDISNKQMETNTMEIDNDSSEKKNRKRKKSKQCKSNLESLESINVNPNAVTNMDTDSEHDSDNEIDSENEVSNKAALESEPADASSDEGPEEEKIKKNVKEDINHVQTEDEIKRTLFVGNVPFSIKTKKEMKKIFREYGKIESTRIRTVPVKDARVTPKMAVIKKELHPDRTTVNVYIRYVDALSVNKALAANNTILNGYHLRVSRSDTSGAIHDPKCSVFVGNVPFALEEEGLRSKFMKCGEIESVRIIRDKKTNAGKGFGYVNFASKDGVELALALTEEDLTIKNRILRVKRCSQPTQRKIENNRAHTEMNNFGNSKLGYKQSSDQNQGAFRRIMKKRKNQEGGEGPPNKRPYLNQPHKEKKARKEFVGMTAEKKKKNKFNKGQKKKKALSEVLTKK